MQFHPLAYMVKLKIEMSMAELIAKIARKKERLPTIHTSQSRRLTISSPLRSFTRSGSRPIQPLPPARNAVPFRVWNGSMPSGIDSGHASVRPTPLHSALASQGSATRNSPTASALDLPRNDLYMVQEVTVESEVVETNTVGAFMVPVRPDARLRSSDHDDIIILPILPDGRLLPPDTPRPTHSDHSSYMDDVEPPVIWDGNPMISTIVATGLAR